MSIWLHRWPLVEVERPEAFRRYVPVRLFVTPAELDLWPYLELFAEEHRLTLSPRDVIYSMTPPKLVCQPPYFLIP